MLARERERAYALIMYDMFLQYCFGRAAIISSHSTIVANGMHPSRLYHCCPIGACIFPDLRHGFVHRPPDFPLVKV